MLFEDQSVVRQLVEEFKQNHQQDFERLRQAIDKGNQQQISTIAHRMKGASQMLECNVLARPLESIEKEASLGRFTLDSTAYTSLVALTAQLLEENPDTSLH